MFLELEGNIEAGKHCKELDPLYLLLPRQQSTFHSNDSQAKESKVCFNGSWHWPRFSEYVTVAL